MKKEIGNNGWQVFVNPPAVTINTRDVGGVMCRWWGDGPAPAGVAMIDAAAAVQQGDGSIDSDLPPLPDDPAGCCEVVVGHQIVNGMEGDIIDHQDGYSADQMHAYARLARTAAPSEPSLTFGEFRDSDSPQAKAARSALASHITSFNAGLEAGKRIAAKAAPAPSEGQPVPGALQQMANAGFDVQYGEAKVAPSEGQAIPADRIVAGLQGLAKHIRAVPDYHRLRGDMDIVDQAIAALAKKGGAA